MNYVTLREVIRNKTLKMRAIDRLVEAEIFQELWKESPDIYKNRAMLHIGNLNVEALKNWVAIHPSRDVDDLGYKDLFEIARNIGIKNYSRMNKMELLRAVKHDKATKNRSNHFTD